MAFFFLQLTYNTDYSTVCKGLWCKKPSTSQCQLSLPAEHTPCGNQKVIFTPSTSEFRRHYLVFPTPCLSRWPTTLVRGSEADITSHAARKNHFFRESNYTLFSPNVKLSLCCSNLVFSISYTWHWTKLTANRHRLWQTYIGAIITPISDELHPHSRHTSNTAKKHRWQQTDICGGKQTSVAANSSGGSK